MNLESYLEGLTGAGEFNSSGSFSLTLDQLVESLSQSLWVDPQLAPLFVVAAAARVGARHLEVQSERGKVVYRLEMSEPDLSSQQSLLSEQGHGSEARWLILAMAAQGQPASLLCPAQGRKLSLGSGACAVTPWKSKDGDARLSLEVSQSRGGPPVADLLRRHCSLCPVPLQLAGTLLQKDLTQAHRGSPVAWSASVSSVFHPPESAGLDTKLALFLAGSNAPKPTWVAVVGGVSYPFRLPKARGRVGVVWSDELRTDLSLGSVIEDESWKKIQTEILRVSAAPSRSSGEERSGDGRTGLHAHRRIDGSGSADPG